MQENIQQLGHWDKGLNTFIYHDQQPQRAQLGSLWEDLTGSAQDAAKKAYEKLQTQIKDLPQDLKDKAVAEFLDSPTGIAMTEEAKQGWLNTQVDKVNVIYTQHKDTINKALLGIGGAIVLVVAFKAYTAGKKSGSRAVKVVHEAPAEAIASAQNPRRRRRKKSGQRKSRRRK